MKKVILKEKTTDEIYADEVKRNNIIIRVGSGDPSRLYVLQNINGLYKWIALRSGAADISPAKNRNMFDAIECTIKTGREVYVFKDEQDLIANIEEII